MNVQSLPPKMAAEFASKAREGKADLQLGNSCYIFYQGRNEICLVSIKEGKEQGHITRNSAVEVANRKFGKL